MASEGEFIYEENEDNNCLTRGALEHVRTSGRKYEGALSVQVLEVTQLASKNYQFVVSDSMECCHCNVASKMRQVVGNGAIRMYGIIRITQHVVNCVAGKPVIIALAFNVVAGSGSGLIGDPYVLSSKLNSDTESVADCALKCVDNVHPECHPHNGDAASSCLTPLQLTSPPTQIVKRKAILTSEQKRRVEANRLAAMQKKRQRESTSSVGKLANKSNGTMAKEMVPSLRAACFINNSFGSSSPWMMLRQSQRLASSKQHAEECPEEDTPAALGEPSPMRGRSHTMRRRISPAMRAHAYVPQTNSTSSAGCGLDSCSGLKEISGTIAAQWPLFTGLEKDRDLSIVDAALASCLRPRAICECHGAAGTGKSYLGATLCAFALMRDPESHVLFVETSGARHTSRRAIAISTDRIGASVAERRILFTSALEPSQFVDILLQHLPNVMTTRLVSLVVIDAFADILRDAAEARDRHVDRRRIMAALKKCVKTTGCAFFLINQVVADFAADASLNAVVACNDSLFADIAKIRFKLTRGSRAAVKHIRYITVVTAQPDEKGDVPTAPFLITKAGLKPACLMRQQEDVLCLK